MGKNSNNRDSNNQQNLEEVLVIGENTGAFDILFPTGQAVGTFNSITVGGVSGVPTQASDDGTIVYDETNDDLYVRANGAWDRITTAGDAATLSQVLTAGATAGAHSITFNTAATGLEWTGSGISILYTGAGTTPSLRVGKSNQSGGSDCVFIGNSNGGAGTVANSAVIIGKTNATSLTSGTNMVSIGESCGTTATTATYGVFIGYQANCTSSSSASPVAIGNGTKSSSRSVGIGISADTGTGSSCVVIGDGAGAAGSGAENVLVGLNAGGTLSSTGQRNTCLGSGADVVVNTDQSAVAVGYNAKSNTQGVVVGATSTAADRSVVCGYGSAGDGTYVSVCGSESGGASTVTYASLLGRANTVTGTTANVFMVGHTNTTNSGETYVWGHNYTVTTPNQLYLGDGSGGTGISLKSTATAGAQTLPSNPSAFMPITINGTAYKIPLYNT